MGRQGGGGGGGGGLAVLNDSNYGYSAINFHHFHVVMLCCFVFIVRFVVINGQTFQNMDEGWLC